MPDTAWLSLAIVILIQTALVAFFLGRLSQRVTTIERESAGREGLGDRITRLEVKMDAATGTLERLDGHMVSAQRQLANIAAGRIDPDTHELNPRPPRQRRRTTK